MQADIQATARMNCIAELIRDSRLRDLQSAEEVEQKPQECQNGISVYCRPSKRFVRDQQVAEMGRRIDGVLNSRRRQGWLTRLRRLLRRLKRWRGHKEKQCPGPDQAKFKVKSFCGPSTSATVVSTAK